MKDKQDSIIIRTAKLNDIGELRNFYLKLPYSVKQFFHPFPFDRKKITIIFIVLILSSGLPDYIKKIIPKLRIGLVVAKEKRTSKMIGFVFYTMTSNERGINIANAGPVIKSEVQGRGIGTEMYNLLISKAKTAGINKFRVTIMEDNIGSIIFHEKFGYVNKGYTQDEIWDGKRFKNLTLELDLDK